MAINTLAIDFSRQFDGQAIFMGVGPKMVRVDAEGKRSTDMKAAKVQDMDKASNQPKWSVRLAVEVEAFGEMRQELINITLTAQTQPCTSMAMGEVVTVEGLYAGVLRDGGVYWWADKIVSRLAARSNGALPGQTTIAH